MPWDQWDRITSHPIVCRAGAPIAPPSCNGGSIAMKHLLTGVAVVAALAFAAPVWAQPVSPSGGNPMGMPGPNPGGPGLTPYSGGAPGPKPSGSNYIPPRPPAAMAPAAMAPAAGAPMPDSTSATPPSHRHARHASHAKMAHHG